MDQRRLFTRPTIASVVVVAAAVAVGVVVVVTGTSTNGTAAKRVRFATYTSVSYRFSIEYPAGWLQASVPASMLAAGHHVSFGMMWGEPLSSGGDAATVAIEVYRWNKPYSAKQARQALRTVLEGLRSRIGQSYPGRADLRVEREQAIRLAGSPGVYVRAKDTTSGGYYDSYLVIHSGVGYWLFLSGSPGDFAAYFRNLPETLRIGSTRR
jgi:hypothetical protein